MTDSLHIPVLLDDVISLLDVQEHDIVLDGTLGMGGHAASLISKCQKGTYIGIDQDTFSITHCKEKFKDTHFTALHGNFSNYPALLEQKELPLPNKVLVDLGFSSYQLDVANRGFSFQEEGRLDMRMNPKSHKTAANILNGYSFEALSDMFFHHGDLIHNKKLCETILTTRKKTPFKTIQTLLDAIKKSYKTQSRRQYISICTKVFQAIRMETNQEMHHLALFLDTIDATLPKDGIVALITFHSGEDRFVKHFFKDRKSSFLALSKNQ